MNTPEARLQRLLGGSALAELRQRLRRHYERHPTGQAPDNLQLGQLNALEQERLAELMGRPFKPATTVRIKLAQIDDALSNAEICASLREALAQLDGPLIDRQAARATQAHAWEALAAGQTQDGRLQDPRLISWLRAPPGVSTLKRLSRSNLDQASLLLRQADAVLRQLPAQGMPRAQLAALTLGDAHALDKGRAIASLVLSICDYLAVGPPLTGINSSLSGTHEPTATGNEPSRTRWARVGVLVNELARPALCLNLPILDDARTHHAMGVPAYYALRQLLRAPPTWAVAGNRVFICENPNLLAIVADCLGADSPPLVCTDGMPSAAQRTLLDQLTAAGAHLMYHGDFDWPGLQIANFVLQRWAAQPWRMDAKDYAQALQQAPQRPADLGDKIVQASWDAGLGPLMQQHGLTIAEEAVVDSLLPDLRAANKP